MLARAPRSATLRRTPEWRFWRRTQIFDLQQRVAVVVQGIEYTAEGCLAGQLNNRPAVIPGCPRLGIVESAIPVRPAWVQSASDADHVESWFIDYRAYEAILSVANIDRPGQVRVLHIGSAVRNGCRAILLTYFTNWSW